jgi:D-cysteine desulfhydrase
MAQSSEDAPALWPRDAVQGTGQCFTSVPPGATQDFPLAARFPRLAGRVPRIALNVGPSPVSRLAKLSAALDRDDIWLKNDGLFGSVYGGNKPRKLQFVLADALRRGARRVLTTGTIGTNHGLATAIYARELGLEAALLIAYEEPSANNVATLLRIAGTGARIHYTRSYPLTALVAPYYIAHYWLRDQRMPYLLGPGGSSALAALGYVDAAFELAAQVRGGELPEPAWVVVPLGTGGTVAGLLAGLRLAGLRTRVLAVSATRAPTTWRPAVERLARAAAQRIARESGEREAGQVQLRGLRIESGWLGPGFGRESVAGSAAQVMLDELEGLHLDPVYTAKSMAALIDLSRSGSLPGPVLFWNTYNAIPLPEPDVRAVSRIPASLRRVCRL